MEEIIKNNQDIENGDNSKNHNTTSLPKRSKKNKNNEFNTKECKVVSYDVISKNLVFDFEGINIRINTNFDYSYQTTVNVRYKGQIGKPNFICKL